MQLIIEPSQVQLNPNLSGALTAFDLFAALKEEHRAGVTNIFMKGLGKPFKLAKAEDCVSDLSKFSVIYRTAAQYGYTIQLSLKDLNKLDAATKTLIWSMIGYAQDELSSEQDTQGVSDKDRVVQFLLCRAYDDSTPPPEDAGKCLTHHYIRMADQSGDFGVDAKKKKKKHSKK